MTATMAARPHNAAAIKTVLLLASSLTVMSGGDHRAGRCRRCRPNFAEVPGADVWARLILTAPALFIALASPVAGAIIDRFGRRRMILAGIRGCSTASPLRRAGAGDDRRRSWAAGPCWEVAVAGC